MTWSELAWKNGGRRPLRSAVTIAGVAIAIAALFGLLAFQRGYARGMQSELDRLGAHVLVVPKGCPYDAASIALHGAKWPCYLKEEYLSQVRDIFTVETAAPQFMNAVYDDAGNQAVYVGIESAMRRMRPGWKITGTFPNEPGDLLIGADVAQKRNWALSQSVILPGVPNSQGKVVGLLSPTGGAEDTFTFMRLQDAQRLFKHPNELTHILVRLKNTSELDHAIASLRSCSAGMDMNVVPLAHLFRTIRTLMDSTQVLLAAVALIALLVAGTGVGNTVLMAVVERTREIGIMRALGASQGQVFRLFWLETLQLCLAGGIVGVILAFASSRLLETWLRTRLPFAPTEPLIQWEWSVGLACIGIGVMLGTLVGLLPAWRAATLPPVAAIRARG